MTEEAIYERLTADFDTAVTISMAGTPDADAKPLYKTRFGEHGLDATDLVLTFPDSPIGRNTVKVRGAMASLFRCCSQACRWLLLDLCMQHLAMLKHAAILKCATLCKHAPQCVAASLLAVLMYAMLRPCMADSDWPSQQL